MSNSHRINQQSVRRASRRKARLTFRVAKPCPHPEGQPLPTNNAPTERVTVNNKNNASNNPYVEINGVLKLETVTRPAPRIRGNRVEEDRVARGHLVEPITSASTTVRFRGKSVSQHVERLAPGALVMITGRYSYFKGSDVLVVTRCSVLSDGTYLDGHKPVDHPDGRHYWMAAVDRESA